MVERNKDHAGATTSKNTWVTPEIESFNVSDVTENQGGGNVDDGTSANATS